MQEFYAEASRRLAAITGISEADILPVLQRPPKPGMGEIGFPCFSLAKEQKISPPQVAQELAGKIQTGAPFAEIKQVGPYLNFFLSQTALAENSVGRILPAPENWWRSDAGKDKTVVIDYSSPNIAKPLGVHHIRSTMLGAALCRLYAARGWRVVAVNHLGDWGTNFGQLMVSYKRAEADNPNVPVDIDALLKLYVKFHADAEHDETLNDEARNWFKKLEDGDSEAVRLWKVFVEESLKGLKNLYQRLNVSFDHYTGESFFNDKMEETAARIAARNLLTKSDGAQVVDLEKYDMPPCLIKKSDGATTYATRDLAAAEYRQREYGFAKCLYVVANQQELHFRQVFQTLELMGYDWASGCEHVKFGMLSFGKGVFGDGNVTGSTRKGNVIFLEDVLDRAVAQAKEIISENARDDEIKRDLDALAEQVGVGAIVFSEFLQRRMKDVTFTWEKALNLHGDSGPYLQYTHARLSSLKGRFGRELPQEINYARLASESERAVMLALSGFSGALDRALAENEPSIVAEYLLELCSVFNRMFTDKENHRIVSEDEELSAARVALVEAVRLTLAEGLRLLGLEAPVKM